MIAEVPAKQNSEPIRFSLRKLFRGITLIALVLGAVGIGANYLRQREARQHAERERKARLDRATVAAIVETAESIRAQIGRAPADEAELEALMGQPMPFVHDNGYPTPINYRRTGDNSFTLQYELWATDDWIYDSNAPSAGWVQHYY